MDKSISAGAAATIGLILLFASPAQALQCKWVKLDPKCFSDLCDIRQVCQLEASDGQRSKLTHSARYRWKRYFQR